jgi:hypothetical protein
MKTTVIVAIVAIVLLGFVFTWVILSAQGVIPNIQAPLEHVSPWVKVVALLVLTAIVYGIYSVVRAREK